MEASSDIESPVEGNPASPVRVVAYEDLQCGDCALFRLLLDEQLLEKYGARVAFEHRDFPLPKHEWAFSAAVAARAAAEQNARMGIQLRRYFFVHLGEITRENFHEHLRAFAAKSGLDGERLVSALADQTLRRQVEADLREGKSRGVARTPTIFVNGRMFVEQISAGDLRAAIDQALRSAASRRSGDRNGE